MIQTIKNRKRLTVAFVASIIIGCLYFTAPKIHSFTDTTLSCEPIGNGILFNHHNTSMYPNFNQGVEFYNKLAKIYEAAHATATEEETERFIDREIQGWQRACDVARDSRKMRINITLVVAAVICLLLPKDIRKKKEKMTEDDTESDHTTDTII